MSDPQADLFGRLAVHRGYITSAQLDECKTIQSCQKIPAPLELILIERQYLDDTQLQELLTLVDKGEAALEEAPPAQESDTQPIHLRQDMLFGRILVHKRLVPPEKINACVAEQGRLAEQGKRIRLGKLLVVNGLLTMKQVMDLLEYLRTTVIYCERCAEITEAAVEAGKTYPCRSCGETLTAPQEITTVKATDLFAAKENVGGAPEPIADEAADTAAHRPDEPQNRLGPKDATTRLPTPAATPAPVATTKRPTTFPAPTPGATPATPTKRPTVFPAPAASGPKQPGAMPVAADAGTDEEAESGYTPKGPIAEVTPTRPKPAAPAAPTAPAKPAGKTPMVVIGKGGGVRAVETGPAVADERVWHYAVNRKVQGPVTAEQIRGFVADGKLTPESLVWRKGMQDWQPIGKQPELEAKRAAPPPVASLPPPSPAQELQRKVAGRVGDTMMVRKAGPKVDIAPPRIDGYKILEVVGKGGMGIVYKAYQQSMDRTVAIKVMVPKYSEDPEFVERFTREARASAKVNHPNIIQGIDVKQVDGKWCFIMEFADGQRVGDVIRRGGAMSEARALKVVTEIGSALEHAHRNQVVHRDVKPDNILVTKDGVAKLCDLGLVKVVSEETENSKVGDLIGTPDYMSPEQASGKPDVDQRADIYCLGAAWYHMVTGRVPFPGPNRTVVLMKHLTEPLQPPDEVNPMVGGPTASVIEKMMEKSREERYQNMTEVLRDLQLLSVGANPSTFEAEPPPPQDKPHARRPGRPLRIRRRRFR